MTKTIASITLEELNNQILRTAEQGQISWEECERLILEAKDLFDEKGEVSPDVVTQWREHAEQKKPYIGRDGNSPFVILSTK